MLLHLLLQKVITIERTELTSVYLTIGATICASLLAAGASFWASRKSAITSTRVAELTTKTNREVADIAAQTALALNKATYKNDFYKMIIGHRLQAWKESEKLIGLLNRNGTDSNNKPFALYFRSGREFNEVLDAISAYTPTVFWMGK